MKPCNHFEKRRQQRAIPLAIIELLHRFGTEKHDGHGGIKTFFNHASIKKMKKELGSNFVGQISKFLRAYIVENTSNGQIITTGWRYEHIKHR